jgi:hypothetical protein
MDQYRLNEVVKALKDKGVNSPCSRCGSVKFSVVGESNIPLQESPNMLVIGGPSVPTVIVACDNCGSITQHASLPLGLV